MIHLTAAIFGVLILQVLSQPLWNDGDNENDDINPDFQFNFDENREPSGLIRNVRQEQELDFESNPFFEGNQGQFGNNPPPFTTSTSTQSPTGAATGDSSTTTTASPRFTACVRACLTTPQYNPVCGTDGVTYDNEFRLKCARNCGKNVQLVRGGTCTPL